LIYSEKSDIEKNFKANQTRNLKKPHSYSIKKLSKKNRWGWATKLTFFTNKRQNKLFFYTNAFTYSITHTIN